MERSHDLKVRIRHLADEAPDPDVLELTPSQRLGMMWQLTLDAWAFKGDPDGAESRLQRHVVRVVRGGG